MKDAPRVIIVSRSAEQTWRSVAQTWVRSAASFALFVSLIGIGVIIDSSALQWVGAIVGFLVIVKWASRDGLTIEQARKRLDEIEREDLE